MGNGTNVIKGPVAHAARCDGKYLTFSLAKEEYGIGILKIREIIGMMPITSLPETQRYVKGVINLRGKVIPVIDLRLRFGLEQTEHTERSCIIVVEIGMPDKLAAIGMVVDAVSEVVNVKSDDIEPLATFGIKYHTDYVLGVAKIGKNVKLLIDIDQVIEGGRCEAILKAA